MMPNLGSKKKDNPSRLDRNTDDLPKLSNEMQLSIMMKVKRGELSIEDALHQARMEQDGKLLKPTTVAEEETQPKQYNFSVHKHSHYRWQKRVLQIDFKTKMLCSIEKGIIKRQLPFHTVKSCDDGMMKLVNQIIYGNIYSDDAETRQQPEASQRLQEGVLLLHRGGLASFRWVKYEVQLHPDQLLLAPSRRRGPDEAEATSRVSSSIVIHLSGGDASVQKPNGSDAFTLITHKNEYQ
ncbi:hypothetical protein EYF80_018679 [Liparis tanakae]|uniref:Uncharacterized protein n=1 Tax=Liparis tanakae TaxID=230148 RepID=A0A4Z2HZ80_9TELE|nr:hypothetical protein EYF80_018679 [Liparis tanakae]